MKTSTTLFGCAVFLFSTLPAVLSHGVVGSIVVGGQTFKGPKPGQAAIDSPIRQVTDVAPVKDVTSKDLTCGVGAKLATQVANVTAGSDIAVHWVNGEGGASWPHEVGPIMSYVAACAGNDCTTDDASSAKWIKIAEAGQNADGKTWAMADLFAGKPHTVTLPKTLPAGSYLLRSELITLQLATSVGGAEFYPSCFQFRVPGSAPASAASLAKSVPASDVVSFPGAYSATDPGIFAPDVYNPGFDYSSVFPGPAIPASFASTAGNSTGTAAPSASKAASTAAAPATDLASATASDSLPLASASIPAATAPASRTASVVVPTASASAPAVNPKLRIITITLTMTLPGQDPAPTTLPSLSAPLAVPTAALSSKASGYVKDSASGSASTASVALPTATFASSVGGDRRRAGAAAAGFEARLAKAGHAHVSRSKRAHRR